MNKFKNKSVTFIISPLATIKDMAGSAVSKQSIFPPSIRYFSSRPWYQ